MAMIEVIFVKPVERLLLIPTECLIQEIILSTDARMIRAGHLTVGHKKDIADERVETVAHPYTITISTSTEVRLHFALGIKLGLHLISAIAQTIEISRTHLIGMTSEECVEHTFGNVGTGEEFLAEVEAITLNLFGSHGHSRRELSEQTMHTMQRNLPNAEESQHMVYTVGIEVLGHLTEATNPPLIAISSHRIPIVSRESPVLSVHTERIGRCTSLSIHIEIMGFYPCFHTVAADTDRNIPLDDHTLLAGITSGFEQLDVEQILNIAIKTNFPLGLTLYQRRNLVSTIDSMGAPHTEVCRPVQVAQIAEGGIRTKPLLIIPIESLVFLSSQRLFPLFLI